ncbi:MAG: DUF2807 domain-containing protein [Muribaculaceae bacterium]|nr:DUF2807 domain-containing protein [Muribaculaceae bacterium]
MKKIFILSILALAALSISAVGCKIYVNGDNSDGSGQSVTVGSGKRIEASANQLSKTLDVENFNAVKVSGNIQVLYVESPTTEVEFTAPDNVMEYYKYKVKDGELKVWLDGKVSINYPGDIQSPKLLIKAPSITGITLSGASGFVTKALRAPESEIEIDLSGASSLTVENVNCKKFDAEISGASSVKIADIKAGVVDLECNGASNASMVADVEAIEVDCSGASNVKLSGKATSAIYECSGASQISASKLEAVNGKANASGMSSVKSNIRNITSQSASGMSKVSNK